MHKQQDAVLTFDDPDQSKEERPRCKAPDRPGVLTVDRLVWHSQTTPLAALPVDQGEITRKSRTGVSAGNRRFYESFNCRQTAAAKRLSRQAMRECAGKRLLAAAVVVAA
jgi:hypothetical protein